MNAINAGNRAIDALRKPDASLARVPNTIRQSIADVISDLQREIGDLLWSMTEEAQRKRAEAMPDDQAARNALQVAYQRLHDLGWNNAMYAPKDGTTFEVCQLGSIGVFKCSYSGEWPTGHYMVQDGNDVYPQGDGGLLWRPLKH